MATCILMLFAVSPFLEHSHSPLVAYQAGWQYSISLIVDTHYQAFKL